MEYSKALTSSRATLRPQAFGPRAVCLYEDTTYPQTPHAEPYLTLRYSGRSDCSRAFKQI